MPTSSSTDKVEISDLEGTTRKQNRGPTPAEITAAANPSHRRRMMTSLAFPLLILLAVPYWWYTTSIVRLPLPIDRIAALESSTVSRSESFNASCRRVVEGGQGVKVQDLRADGNSIH